MLKVFSHVPSRIKMSGFFSFPRDLWRPYLASFFFHLWIIFFSTTNKIRGKVKVQKSGPIKNDAQRLQPTSWLPFWKWSVKLEQYQNVLSWPFIIDAFRKLSKIDGHCCEKRKEVSWNIKLLKWHYIFKLCACAEDEELSHRKSVKMIYEKYFKKSETF